MGTQSVTIIRILQAGYRSCRHSGNTSFIAVIFVVLAFTLHSFF